MSFERVRPSTLSSLPASPEELRQRVEGIPRELSRVLALPRATLSPAWRGVRRFDVTGIGASEGPARLLVAELLELGMCARFVASVNYLRVQDGSGAALIVFSQGLSPNARLALHQAPHYDAALLFTALTGPENASPQKLVVLADFARAGGSSWTHPPSREGGSLVRLVGPACAVLTSLQFVTNLCEARALALPPWARHLSEIPAATARSFQSTPEVLGADPGALLSTGPSSGLLRSFAWKWQEALFTRLPPDFDVLSFMHGPLQSQHGQERTLVLCRGPAHPSEEDLIARLRCVLHDQPHTLVEIAAMLPGPLAWFELDSAFNKLVLGEIEARGLSPGHWPAQGLDEPLYQLGE